VPGYKEEESALKSLGIDEVIIYCVNDGAVMDAWAESQGVSGPGLISMMGDPSGKVTSSLGMALTHPGPMSVLGYERCKRFALYIEDGVIKIVKVAEKGPMGEEDPAGDDFPEETLAPSMIAAIKALKKKDEL
jgi:peroxiredoxin